MARVFISHASADADLAATVAGWLTGHRVFLDQDPRAGLSVGDNWPARLHQELRGSDVLICLITEAFRASDWCTMEIAVALSRDMVVLPVRVDGDHPQLPATIQYTPLAEARVRLREALLRVDNAGGGGWPDGKNPYPGLPPFTKEYRKVFFGRSAETARLVDLLRRPSGTVLAVVGPSGCGKSSLVRAGLSPAIAADPEWWVLPPVPPSPDPVGAVASAVAAESVRLGRHGVFGSAVRAAGLASSAADLLAVTPGAGRLLLVLDQFEEVLSQADPAVLDELARELANPGPVRVVLTIRPEFLDGRRLAHTALGAVPVEPFAVGPLRTDALRTVIAEPAALAGFAFETGLVDRMIADTDTGEGLPLLAYALSQLGRHAHRGSTVSLDRYEEIGGVHGALIREAEAALAETERAESDVLATLLRLVAVDAAGRPTRKRVPRAELDPFDIDPFIARRLLTGDTAGTASHVKVAHDAFLTVWPPLAKAIGENLARLRARDAVEAAIGQWARAGNPRRLLWDGGHRAAMVEDLGDLPLGPAATEFLRKSKRRDTVRRHRWLALVAALLLVLAGGVLTKLQQMNASDRQQSVTLARLLMARADAIRPTDPRTALRLNVAALRLAGDGDARAALVAALGESSFIRVLTDDVAFTGAAAFAGDGTNTVATAGSGGVLLWDVTNPYAPRRLRPPPVEEHEGFVAVAFSPDGSTLVGGSTASHLVVWDIADRDNPRRLAAAPAGGDGIAEIAFPDRHTVMTTGLTGSVRIWDLRDRARPRPAGEPLAPAKDTTAVAVGHTGQQGWAAVAHAGAVSVRRDVAGRWSRPTTIERPASGDIVSMAFRPPSPMLPSAPPIIALGSSDGWAELWDAGAAPPELLDRFRVGEQPVRHVAFSADGGILTTSTADGLTTFWDFVAGRAARRAEQIRTAPRSYPDVTLGPDGRSLLTSSQDDGQVVLWEPGPRMRPLAPPTSLHQRLSAAKLVALSPDDRTVALYAGGRLELWDVSDPAHPRIAAEPVGTGAELSALSFSADARTVFAEAGHQPLWWTVDGSNRLQRVEVAPLVRPARPGPIAVAPDGLTMATDWDGRSFQLWDVREPGSPRPIGTPIGERDNGSPYLLSFGRNSRYPVTASAGGRIRIWDSGALADRPIRCGTTADVGDAAALAVAPRGDLVAAAWTNGDLILWRVTPDRRCQFASTLPDNDIARTGALAFNRDGTVLVGAGPDGTAQAWDVGDPQFPARIGAPAPIPAGGGPISIGSGTRLLITPAAEPGGRRLLDLTRIDAIRRDPVSLACSMAAGGLRPGEWDDYLPGTDYQDTCAR